MKHNNKPQSDQPTVLPDLYLEKLVLGELTSEEQSRVDQFLSPTQQRGLIEELRQENRRLLESFPKDTLVKITAGVQRPASNTSASRSFSQWSRFAVAACAVLALTAVWLGREHLSRETADILATSDILLKGSEPRIAVYKKLKSGYERLRPETTCGRGDLLQLRYLAAGFTHGAIISLDGRGRTTLHYPESADGSTKLRASGEVTLPFAYELDDAPQFEIFFFVVSSESFDVNEMLSRVKALASKADPAAQNLDLPSYMSQSNFVVRKSEHE